MKYYKLTDKNLQTYKGCQWVVGDWKETSGEGELCSEGWLHCYHHPLLAVLHNPIHANIFEPLVWEVEVGGKYLNDNFIKCGFTKMRLVKQIELPVVTTNQRVAYGIYSSLEVYENTEYRRWAENWLNGTDRSITAAAVARTAARAAACFLMDIPFSGWASGRRTDCLQKPVFSLPERCDPCEQSPHAGRLRAMPGL